MDDPRGGIELASALNPEPIVNDLTLLSKARAPEKTTASVPGDSGDNELADHSTACNRFLVEKDEEEMEGVACTGGGELNLNQQMNPLISQATISTSTVTGIAMDTLPSSSDITSPTTATVVGLKLLPPPLVTVDVKKNSPSDYHLNAASDVTVSGSVSNAVEARTTAGSEHELLSKTLDLPSNSSCEEINETRNNSLSLPSSANAQSSLKTPENPFVSSSSSVQDSSIVEFDSSTNSEKKDKLFASSVVKLDGEIKDDTSVHEKDIQASSTPPSVVLPVPASNPESAESIPSETVPLLQNKRLKTTSALKPFKSPMVLMKPTPGGMDLKSPFTSICNDTHPQTNTNIPPSTPSSSLPQKRLQKEMQEDGGQVPSTPTTLSSSSSQANIILPTTGIKKLTKFAPFKTPMRSTTTPSSAFKTPSSTFNTPSNSSTSSMAIRASQPQPSIKSSRQQFIDNEADLLGMKQYDLRSQQIPVLQDLSKKWIRCCRELLEYLRELITNGNGGGYGLFDEGPMRLDALALMCKFDILTLGDYDAEMDCFND